VFDVPRATLSRFTFGGAYYAAPVWSPDSSRIAFFSYRDGPWTIYEKPLSREAADRLLLKASNNLVPTDWAPDAGSLLSPDGRWIAYRSDESGRFEVYVRAFGPSGAAAGGKWQVSTNGGIELRWPRRGREKSPPTASAFWSRNPPRR
jgi:Tol biopolymer transport system component